MANPRFRQQVTASTSAKVPQTSTPQQITNPAAPTPSLRPVPTSSISSRTPQHPTAPPPAPQRKSLQLNPKTVKGETSSQKPRPTLKKAPVQSSPQMAVRFPRREASPPDQATASARQAEPVETGEKSDKIDTFTMLMDFFSEDAKARKGNLKGNK